MNIRTAFLSVTHKSGIDLFARNLDDLGWSIWSSGGTAEYLRERGITVADIGDKIGEAILGHRVVTLSREFYAGILARDTESDMAELAKLGVPKFGLVCCDFYDLKTAIAAPGATYESVVEQTDIGGPCMVRAAAKGGQLVIANWQDRDQVIHHLTAGEPDSFNFRRALAAKAEYEVAKYCLASAEFLSQGGITGLVGRQVMKCKYGENAWQTPAALYTTDSGDSLALDQFRVIDGTDPSYNNACDIDRLVQVVTHLAAALSLNFGAVPALAVAVKHGNPCGAAMDIDPTVAMRKMVVGDHTAIFGGLVMTNFPVDDKLATDLLYYGGDGSKRLLLDGVIAPAFTEGAIDMLGRKNGKCRVIVNPALANLGLDSLDTAPRFRYTRGGFLLQPNYTHILDWAAQEMVVTGELSPDQKRDLTLAWAVGAHSNSNTITLAKDGQLLANAVGQQDRWMAAMLAGLRAQRALHDTVGAVTYSDSFFPEVDGPEELVKRGISACLTSSGSVRDPQVRAYFAQAGVALAMYPDPLGRGFYGH